MDDDAVRRFISVCVIKFVSRQEREREVETHEEKAKYTLISLSGSRFSSIFYLFFTYAIKMYVIRFNLNLKFPEQQSTEKIKDFILNNASKKKCTAKISEAREHQHHFVHTFYAFSK